MAPTLLCLHPPFPESPASTLPRPLLQHSPPPQADPHPGNLLLRPDGGLVLLDFGQAKALPARTHASLAELIIALADGVPGAITGAMARLGLEFRARAGGPAPPEEVAKMAYIFFDTR